MEELGPVQIMVVGFEDPNFTGEVLSELRRLKDALKNDRARAIRLSTLTAVCEALDCEIGELLVLAD